MHAPNTCIHGHIKHEHSHTFAHKYLAICQPYRAHIQYFVGNDIHTRNPMCDVVCYVYLVWCVLFKIPLTSICNGFKKNVFICNWSPQFNLVVHLNGLYNSILTLLRICLNSLLNPLKNWILILHFRDPVAFNVIHLNVD